MEGLVCKICVLAAECNKCAGLLSPFASNVGNRVRKSSSRCVSLSVHSENSRDCQQHQETEGGNYKGMFKTKNWRNLN